MKKLMKLNARVASVMLATILAFAPTLTALADSNNVSQDTISENSSIPGNEMSIMTMSSESAQTNNVLSWDFIADTFNNTSNDAHADLDLDTGTLTLRGTHSNGVSLGNYARNGDSALQAYINSLPFTVYKDSIKTIIVDGGISSIANGLFESYSNLEKVVINCKSHSLSIGKAFQNCTNLNYVEINSDSNVYIKYNGTSYWADDTSPFKGSNNITKLVVNASSVAFDAPSFNTSNLEELVIGENTPITINTSLFYGSKWAINKANENGYAYLYDTLIRTNPDLTSVEIPDNINKLASKSLINNNITELTLKKGYTLYEDSIQSSSLKS